jgi:alpha-tubulin suppressor-like RCC1 family protein
LVDSVASGYDHSCAVTITSDAYCWGNNVLGQLGDGSFIQRVQPTPVFGISPAGTRIAFASQIAAGESHTCVRTPPGTVFCWGDNTSGQVGNANLGTLHPFPSVVPGLGTAVQQLEAGAAFTCALGAAGGVQCWGENMDGQLGDGTTISRFAPAAVSGLSTGVMQIGLGDFHACADASTGLRYCWGDSFFGQLGNGATTMATVPIEVLGPEPLPFSLPAQIVLGLTLALAGALLAHRQVAGAR